MPVELAAQGRVQLEPAVRLVQAEAFHSTAALGGWSGRLRQVRTATQHTQTRRYVCMFSIRLIWCNGAYGDGVCTVTMDSIRRSLQQHMADAIVHRRRAELSVLIATRWGV